MPAVVVPVHTITRAGTALATPAACDSVNGNVITANSGMVFLELQNTDTAGHTVDVSFVGVLDGQVLGGRTIELAASAHGFYGGWPVNTYGSTVNFKADNALVKAAAYQVTTE
jgi:hypothetical protein